ncbi:protein of unknown function [Polaribacter sp. KT25b]|uniref:sialate O-acetylesterase n=1 Tax=Polaribacter sp. KT25b TaxID=1855336 RepID=UPI00087B1F35|nr:sialate O-acetylesterase [Polaribacter sp. KT25b]SDR70228.1 protein of unknown function [Polaribacter sp. KT25b]
MKKNIFLLFLLMLASCKSSEITAQNDVDIQVVLLAGQSNMAGAGNFDELESNIINRIQKISDRVSLVFNGKLIKPLSYYDNKPSEKYNFTKRFGPELLMGLTLAENNPTKKYLLIKRSQGGTALYGAWNPNWSSEKAQAIEKDKKQKLQLFSMHIEDIQKSLAILKSEEKTYKIIGLAWMQGENDATLIEAARSYASNLKALILKYRTIFKEEKMPFVIGEINSRYGVKDGAKIVRNQMESFVNKTHFTALIKTSTNQNWLDYPKHKDNVHYNTEGQVKLGTAFAFELMKMIK